jgi:1-deoxy-D-xylulose-5-phosphate reductoisomerase
MTEPRRVTVLGSTGSIGRNTLDLIARNGNAFEVVALTAHRNVGLLAEQARRFDAALAVIADPAGYAELKDALADTNIEAAAGPRAVTEAAQRPADLVMAAIVGAAGLEPTMAAVATGVTVALANKESLVCAGSLMMGEVARSGATLLPVDSEHNAIFQVFDFAHPERVEQIMLTASGGPFREVSMREMAGVTPEQAVAHPNWDMGAKISVDSATMMNKGLELIEAVHLFPVSAEKVHILVHPQSVVHSLVAYVDGSVLAQMGTPDMRTPISYALAWPERMATPATRLDLGMIGNLSFEAPDVQRFPAIRLAREALQEGGGAPTILNAANEVAVHQFLERRIGFLDIAMIVERTLEVVSSGHIETVDDVIRLDQQARRAAESVARHRIGRIVR